MSHNLPFLPNYTIQIEVRVMTVRDYEHQPAVSEALIRWAAIAGMARCITHGEPARRQNRLTFSRT